MVGGALDAEGQAMEVAGSEEADPVAMVLVHLAMAAFPYPAPTLLSREACYDPGCATDRDPVHLGQDRLKVGAMEGEDLGYQEVAKEKNPVVVVAVVVVVVVAKEEVEDLGC